MPNWKRKLRCKLIYFHKFLMFVGSWTGCHQMPARSFFIKGIQFPLCARCTGIVAGYLFGAVMLLKKTYIPLQFCLLGAVIMFFDWYVQYIGVLPSTNLRRFITGLLCGVGYLQFWIQLFLKLWDYLRV